MPVNILLNSLFKELKELILPSKCLVCNIYSQGYICPGCQKTLEETITPMYEYSLKVHSLFQYHGKIREVLHKFKYDRFQEAGLMLGNIMGRYYLNLWQEKYDLFVPVPLYEDELKERGFNQSEILARGFVSVFPQNLSLSTLVKIKKTRRQVNLNLTERRENLKNAFSVNGSLSGKTILIIDDVFTTGETFKACKSALIRAGAREAQGVTFCRQI